MLHRRVPSPAAFWALILGLVMIGTKYFLIDILSGVDHLIGKSDPFIAKPAIWLNAAIDGLLFYNFHFLGAVFATLCLFMIIWAAIAPREKAWTLETGTPINMTPWKNAKWASLILVVIVIAIYSSFASFGG